MPTGLTQRHPDFEVLHPRRGMPILEVKDWKTDTTQHADKIQFSLITQRGLVKENNPLLHSRVCALEIGIVLERDPALRHPQGHNHAGVNLPPFACPSVCSTRPCPPWASLHHVNSKTQSQAARPAKWRRPICDARMTAQPAETKRCRVYFRDDYRHARYLTANK